MDRRKHIYWENGLLTGVPETSTGKHTRCSAFVASAAKKLGVCISCVRRSTASSCWRKLPRTNGWPEEVRAHGWHKLADAHEAQAAAKTESARDGSCRWHRSVYASSALSIRAGSVNGTSISIKAGFAGHPAARRVNEIVRSRGEPLNERRHSARFPLAAQRSDGNSNMRGGSNSEASLLGESARKAMPASDTYNFKRSGKIWSLISVRILLTLRTVFGKPGLNQMAKSAPKRTPSTVVNRTVILENQASAALRVLRDYSLALS